MPAIKNLKSASNKTLIDKRIDAVTLIAAGFLGLAAITAEVRSKVLFQSWSFLFASGCLAASCILPNKRLKSVARTIGIIEVGLTVSITQISKYSSQFRNIKAIQLDHASLFSDDKHKDFLKKRTEFTPLLGRQLIPNRFGHTAEGFRKIPSAPSEYQSTINIYGGSTTYDTSVTAEKSWPNQLQLLLNKENLNTPKIRNLGIPGGTTSEAIVYSSFNDLDDGIVPICSIHFHGWNDLRNNFVPNLTNSYKNWHLLSMTEAGSIGSHHSTIIGLVNLIASKVWTEGQLHYLIKQNTSPKVYDAPQILDERLKFIFSTNLDTLIALGRRHKGNILMVPQVLNPEKLKKNGRYGWLPNVDDQSLIDLISEVNAVSESKADNKHVLHADQITQDKFTDADFTDNGHFSANGSKKFAKLLLPSVLKCINSTT